MKKMTVLLAWLCFTAMSMSAETIYLNANGGCIDRMEYQLTNGNTQKTHTVFSLSPQADTKLFLNVGSDNGSVLDRLPGNLQSCSKARTFDLNTIRRINVGELEVFIVRQTPQGYALKKVNNGAWMQHRGQEIEYANADMDFKTNLNYINYGTPLSSSLSKSEVSMDNYSIFDCSSMISFRQSPNRSTIPQSTFQLVPELGITSIAYGWNAANAKTKMQLKTINGRNFKSVLADKCKSNGRSYNNSDAVTYTARGNAPTSYSENSVIYHDVTTHYNGSTPYNRKSDYIPPNAIHTGHIGLDGVERPIGYQGNTVVKPVEIVPNSYETEDVYVIAPQKEEVPTSYDHVPEVPKEYFTARSVDTSPNPCGASAEKGYHLVQKGETLYAISRKYNIPVKQVQAWNGIGNSLIKPCMAIRVSEDGAPNPAVVTTTKPAPQEKPAVTSPAPEPAKTFTEKSVERTDMKWLDQGEGHTVAAGETVANLAARYGYTEERFRYINGMSSNATLRVGQSLRTTDCNCLRAPTPYEAEDAAIITEKKVPTSYVAEDAKIFTEKSAVKNSTIAKTITSKAAVPSEYDVVSLAPEGSLVHLVRKEDTLFSIAKRYETTVEAILKLNGMDKGEVIIPAQRLYVK